ncbi:unnamed protein product [Didymodactylos carnosus]|uniref:Uncharacterized protein n=1 Tax=Didymodactylos carnosus TaxID=1234261 RepID=A0A814ENZ9_9BILA|nr:unnamed protein product [Didymodactylos carnosus]CAF3746857.1 unnamed protein product [Didymodactylos carnosus]
MILINPNELCDSGKEEKKRIKFECTQVLTENHKKPIYAVAVNQHQTSDGGLLFATSAGNEIHIYKHANDVAGGKSGVVRVIEATRTRHFKPLHHFGSVNQMAFASHQPKLMVSACSNLTVYLWDVSVGLCLSTFFGPYRHYQQILSVDINHDGTLAASGSMDCSVCIWSITETRTLKNIQLAETKPQNSKEHRLMKPHRVHVPLFLTSTLHDHYVDSVKFFDEIMITKSADNTFCIWNYDLKTSKTDANVFFKWKQHDPSPDILFDIRLGISSMEKVRIACLPITLMYSQSKRLIREVSFTSDGRTLFALDEDIFETSIGELTSNDHVSLESLDETYKIPLFQTRYVTISIKQSHVTKSDAIQLRFQSVVSDKRVIQIREVDDRLENIDWIKDLDRRSKMFTMTWSIKSIYMDMTTVTFKSFLLYDNQTVTSKTWNITILVSQPKRVIDKIWFMSLPFLIVFISVQMGVLLDTSVIKDIVKKPTPLIIGFVAQYGLMPLLAYSITKIFRYTALHGLTLFLIGCCPGGTASNQWTLLFDGDVNLSAVMSFTSTLASFFMMPLWFYTLGNSYLRELKLHIPFLGLLRTLATIVVPYTVGILISHYSPKTRNLVKKIVKPMMLFLVIFFLVFGTLVNWYMFKMIDLYSALTAPLLPWIGFLLGGLLALICRQDWSRVKTIGIEAGIQNVGIAFMVIMYSFPQPQATQGLVVPLVVALLTTKPFYLALLIRHYVKKHQKKQEIEMSVVDGNGHVEKTLLENKEESNSEKIHPEEVKTFIHSYQVASA